MFLRGIAFSIISLFIISCTPTTISYNLSDGKKYSTADYARAIAYYKLEKLTLSIQPFHDDRKNISYLKEKLFNFNNENKNNTECYNWEYQYGKLIVSDRISELLANHIDSMKIFKEVYFNEKEKADLYMTGNLISFSAHANTNKDAMKAAIIQGLGAPLGIIGGAIAGATTGDIKSDYDYEIKYANIIVYDNKGNIVYQLPEFTSHGAKRINPISSCDGFFRLINYQLENHNDLFIDKIIDGLPKALDAPR